MMLMDEAFSDVCACYLLERLAGREETVTCMDPDDILTMSHYPRGIRQVSSFRDRINRRLEEELSTS